MRDGSFFEPVRGEKFDLIATNPPFVISPATGERLVYRDSGLPGDRVVEDIVRAAPAHLTEHGAGARSWPTGRSSAAPTWDERLGVVARPTTATRWSSSARCIDPSEYVEMWLKDEGVHGTPDYPHRYDTWLSWFDEQGIEGVGFGWINLQAGGPASTDSRSGATTSSSRSGRPSPTTSPRPAARVDLSSHLVARDDVMQETQGAPGAEDPATIVVRQQRGFRRARQVDTVEAALIGASDGDLSVGQILDAVAAITERRRRRAAGDVPAGRARARRRGLPHDLSLQKTQVVEASIGEPRCAR